MNKVKFDGKVLDLYSSDYKYMQDEAEAEIQKTLRQTLQNPGTAMVIKGFKLQASPADSSKIEVYHDGTWSSAISSVGRLIESEDDIDLVEASDSTAGVINYVYIRSSTGYGTYNKSAEAVEMYEQKNIDYYDYSNIYDREVDVWEIVVYTAAEVSALSAASAANLILLGDFIANGSGPITTITTSGRIDAKTFVADESIDTGMISPTGMLMLQTNVDNSAVYDDTYAGTATTLENDLNRIRYFIRRIKGTDNWDDYLANNLSVFDASINDLHQNGIMQDIRDEFELVPNSTGHAIFVTGGKALLEGVVEGIPVDDPELLTPDAQPDYAEAADQIVVTVAGDYQLTYPHVANFVMTPAYTEGVDYTVDSSSGVLSVREGGNIGSETVSCAYDYGYERYDVIELGEDNDTQIVKGVSATDVNRIAEVPAVTAGYIPLSVIKVYPHLSVIPTANIVDYKSFSPKVRNLDFVACTESTEIKTAINKITYHTSADARDGFNTQWSLTTYSGKDVAISSTVGSYITSSVFCDAGAELWVILDKNIWAHSITVTWEITPGSDVYDGSQVFDLQWRYQSRYNPLLVTSALTEGIHKVKIEVTTADDVVGFYGIVSGKTSLRHAYPHMNTFETYLDNMLVESSTDNVAVGVGTLTSGVTGTKNIAIGTNSLAALTLGDSNVAIGYNALLDNTTGSDNIAVGEEALTASTIGINNIGIGYQALGTNTTGVDNVAIGYQALGANTLGTDNVAIGSNALDASISGVDNIAIGDNAGSAVTTANRVIILGADVAGTNTDDTTYIDNIYGDTTTDAPNVIVGSNGRLQRYDNSSVATERGVPIGSIVAWVPGYFDGAANTNFTDLSGSVTLPAWWKDCDGSDINDADSPIFKGAGRYLPNLTDDRFLMGGTTGNLGIADGDNDGHSHEVQNVSGALHIDSSGSHAHSIYTYWGGSIFGGQVAHTGYTTYQSTESTFHNSHTHSRTDFDGKIGDVDGFDGDIAGSNLPQYLSCRYIMRIK